MSTGAGGWLVGAGAGVLVGLSLFTFGYARGASYLTDNPAACANCHVMRDQYAGWMKSSHHRAAVCNDCHTPPGVIGKYSAKALNGFFHSMAFSTGRFPDEIRITRWNHGVADAACLKCHAEVTESIRAAATHRGGVSCVRCHQSVGH